MLEYEEFRQKILDLQSYHGLFSVEFLDRDRFKQFADNLSSNLDNCREICITGYFSETIREALERLLKKTPPHHISLICPELDLKSKRDQKNLQVLKRLTKVGAEIKVNNRLHARFLVAYQKSTYEKQGKWRGLLVIGSFDFNNDCLSLERYDAGIKTMHPDLIESAAKFFGEIWNEPESLDLNKRYP